MSKPKIIPGLDASYHPKSKTWVVDPVWAKEQVLKSEEKQRAKQSKKLDQTTSLPLSEAEAEHPLHHYLA